ncbi:hypothetical protein [Homoserinibacter gongjuensis]|uniref:Uncharacterized protein n=1 Tax=Homoserinibacter gongjuensis TaxID=1162968 RepID=A0ABQ6JY07_9MICO|nr:hypothetical protein [Homoserinibacter gongjuensis]GMA91577.1 hypothetical protein GCM10025869_21060 [Homoserinibacter gongjuensis]
MRTVISLVVALLASLLGTVLLWYGGGHAVFELGRFAAEGAGFFPLLVALGCLLLAGAAVTVRWSRAGVIAAGAVHVLFSLLGILVPFQPMDGISSPTTQLLGMLFDVDPALATGGYYFVAFGAGLLIGFALLGVGILARRGRPTVLARVLSAVGGLLALGACGWAFAAGGDFYRRTFQMLDWDAVTAVTLVVAALIFGALIALSGRSAIGSWIAGGVMSLVGVILLVADPVAYAGLGSEVLIILPVLGWSGAILAVGMTVLGLALGVTLRAAASAGAERHTASGFTQDAASGAV